MTTKYLSGNYPAGYTLAAGYTRLVVQRTAYVGGSGVDVGFRAVIANRGTIAATGTSGQGVYLQAGGRVINGDLSDTAALISGYGGVSVSGAAGAVDNFGTIESTGKSMVYPPLCDAVYLGDGGSVTNGSAADTTALLVGYANGVAASLRAATVTNFATINAAQVGVDLGDGGSVINGSATDKTALLIANAAGVEVTGARATVTNFGTIEGAYGVSMLDATVINGSASDTTALIIGGRLGVGTSVDPPKPSTVINYGTIDQTGDVYNGVGISFLGGGTVINGSAADKTAVIEGGARGIQDASTVINNGTIVGAVSGGAFTLVNDGLISDSVYFEGGTLTNGSPQNRSALITGYFYGVEAYRFSVTPIRVTNYGTIAPVGKKSAGVDILGSLTNGSAADTTALIAGEFGVIDKGGVVTNYGTIEGEVKFIRDSGDVLIAEAGSIFTGPIEGGGGRLDLAGGVGNISGLGGNGTLTGSISARFSGFASYAIGTSGAWTLQGEGSLQAGAALMDSGTLTNDGQLNLGGTVSIFEGGVFDLNSGNIAPDKSAVGKIVDSGLMIANALALEITVAAQTYDDGVVEAATGTLDFTSQLLGTGVLKIDGGATLEADAAAIATLTATFDGPAATLALKIPNAFHATIGGLVVGDAIDLLALTATGASVNGSDQLVVVNGSKTVATLQLTGGYVGATFSTAADGHGGTNVELVSPGANLPSVPAMAAAMASLSRPAALALPAHGFSPRSALSLVNPHVHLQ